MDWFLYDNGTRHERVKEISTWRLSHKHENRVHETTTPKLRKIIS